MSRLAVFLLGPPHIERDGEPVHIGRRKAVALLAYIAVEARRHSRDTLATLLWPDFDQRAARKELRKVLSVLNVGLGKEWSEIDHGTVGLHPESGLWLDVDQLRQHLAACETHGHPPTVVCEDCVSNLKEAVALYQEDFMAGFTLRDSPAFDDWQRFVSEELRRQVLDALEALTDYHNEHGSFDQAQSYAWRALHIDDLRESAHRGLMTALAASGQRTAALAQYQICQKRLRQELGVEPSIETTALYEQIQADALRDTQARLPQPVSPQRGRPAFLSTDIEHATQLWETHREAMLPVLLDHNRILEEQISLHGGRILELRGDGVKAVFEGIDPLPCALAIQVAFGRHEWGEVGNIRIRVGLYGVPPEQEGHEYVMKGEQDYGPALQQAQSIMDAARGGQILVSEGIRNAFPLPPGATWKEMGEHTLEGVEESQPVFALLHPDLPLRESLPSRTVLNKRYQIESELGRGGMAIVYRAHDALLERDVAVKVLSGQAWGSEGSARLLHEARATAKLSHPSIASVYDAGEVDGVPFIVIELVEGASLHNLKVAGELPPERLEEIVAIARQVCAALEHAHGYGVIHRDIKPENVLLAPDGTAKLMDFGLARSVASRLTAEGTIAGTVFYLAPELALGQPFDGRADLYALGVMLYELTTGRLPFTGHDPLAVISQHLHAPVVPPRAKNAAIPPALDALIARLLSKDPDDRPASATEVLRILDASDVLDQETVPAEELSLLERIERGRLVGRERELQTARGLWNRALAGQGQGLLISGEPGVGKTRLVRELVTHARVTGGRALVGASYAEGGAPYAAFRQIIRQVLRSPASPSTIDGFNGALAEILPEPVLADLLLVAPELRVRYPDVTPNPSLDDPRAEQYRLFENLLVFVTLLSERAPLLLALEDVHWADSGTLSLLRHLARHTRQGRVMLVATYREVELDEARPLHEVRLDLQRERLATWLKLTRLDRAATEELLAVLFDEEITPDFLEGIYHETEGNPFFIEEVCKALAESGALTYEDGRWRRPSVAELGIPQSVRVAIQSRVRALPAEAQETLRLAAFLGREFDWDILKEASQSGEEALLDGLERAERAQLIEALSGEGGERFAFVHGLIASTLVESTRALRRRLLHRRAAAALEARHPGDYAALAYHYNRAGEVEKATGYLLQTADQARRLYANEEAIEHYRQVLASLGESSLFQSRRAWRLDTLQGLGQVYVGIGRWTEAEGCLREAITLGQEMGLAPQELVRYYFWLGEVCFWQSRYDECIRIGEEGLALLAADTESPAALNSAEAAWMNQTIAGGYFGQGDMEGFGEFSHRTAGFIERLPYAVELRPAYIHIIVTCYSLDKDVEETKKWLRALEERVTRHHDLRALAEVHLYRSELWALTGDLHSVLSSSQQALELYTQIGYFPSQIWSLLVMGFGYLSLGHLPQAAECADRARAAAKTVRSRREMALANYLTGQACLCQGDWEGALGTFQEAAERFQKASLRLGEIEAAYRLGQASLARKARTTALQQLRAALALLGPEAVTGFHFRLEFFFILFPPVPVVAGVLAGLEEAYKEPADFQSFCDRYREQHMEIRDAVFRNWYLEPTELVDSPRLLVHDTFAESLSSDWVWEDPFDDCGFAWQNGLVIHAANGRNLLHINRSAPRMLRPVSGDWVAETVCTPVSNDRPSIGGLVLWKDRKNYLRLDRGAAGEREILFSGCLENRDVVIGRGRLVMGDPGFGNPGIRLRLERVGGSVRALCSAEGEGWFTVGQIEFPVEDPVMVGVHAIGSIDRAIYRGAYPDGTTIRFESFTLWDSSE